MFGSSNSTWSQEYFWRSNPSQSNQSVLATNHISESAQPLIVNLYTDFHSYVISDSFSASAILFKRGVLQGECLRHFIFSLCFNTFIQFIKQEIYIQFGLLPLDDNDRLFHWLLLLMNVEISYC